MQKEKLKQCLRDEHLMVAIRARENLYEDTQELKKAAEIMEQVGIGKEAIIEVLEKAEEYHKIRMKYDNLIESSWGLRWQDVTIISRYLDADDCEIDRLPSELHL